MAHVRRLESRVSHAVAGLLSAVLHAGLFLFIAQSGGRQDGVENSDTPTVQLVLLEAPRTGRQDGIDQGLLRPAVPATAAREQPRLHTQEQPLLVLADPEPLLVADPQSDPTNAPNAADVALAVTDVALANTHPAPSENVTATVVEPPPMVVMPHAEATALLERLEHIARKKLQSASRAQVTWQQAGQRYDAELVLERATNGVEQDRVIAEISAESRGQRLRTRILLKRLSFSQFAQIVDFWDPQVQLHDDEVVGPVHINSRLNVLHDSQARPALLGKVSTAAGTYNMQSSGRTHEFEVFRHGIELRTQRISLSDQVNPTELASRDLDARVHNFAGDTRIRFFADGSYWWRDARSNESHYRRDPPGQPLYLIAARGVTLHVQGVVAGRVLVYSPQRIVIEGNLTYARDPRIVANSADYLGLVSDKDIEVAGPRVTGPGDVDIHAALFAKRRFIVTAYEHTRPATLRIFGSLAAGSMTATEPRYATRIEFDRRFEHLRPPGFPAMNRFAADGWDRRWSEVPDQIVSDAF